MKKVLFTATVDSHILNFHLTYLKYFNDNNYEVHVASNGENEIPSTHVKHNIPFQRSPYKFGNIIAYKQLKKIISDNDFDIIHCHTPMGAAITRLAARKSRKKGTKVIYTAHGLHFYKGAPLLNWIVFYPIEKWLSKLTDCLILINNEDYKVALQKFNAHTTKIIDGVGVDPKKFQVQTKSEKESHRIKYKYDINDFILIYVGELSYRKHQDFLIRVVHILKRKIPNIKLLLVGDGEKIEEYKELTYKLELEEYIDFLGYRSDVNNLMMLSDIAVTSSRQEGLPVNVMEAMATGLPLVVSDCRGNRDLIINGVNGFVVKGDEEESFADRIQLIYEDRELCTKLKEENINRVDKYTIDKVHTAYINIYKQYERKL